MNSLAVLMAILSSAGTPAAASKPQILFAEVDFQDPGYPDGLLLVSGFDFGIGAPGVILGGMVLNVVSSTPIHVAAELPPSLAPGTYKLTIVTGNRNRQSLSAAVTVGNQGPPGPAGAPGGPGSPGQDGAPGLACWDKNANGTCEAFGGDEPENEDLDESGSCDALDCRGPVGAPGTDHSAQIENLEARVAALEVILGNCTVEICDGVDNDCDGQIDEGLPGCGGAAQPPALGDLVITEFMRNPEAVPDSEGEWFEVLNTAGHPLDLENCEIRDDAGESAPIEGGVMPGDAIFVFANNPDPGGNGGFFADVTYENFTLSNTDDEIVIECQGELIDRVAYTVLFPNVPGTSVQLDPVASNAAENDDIENWCNSTTPFGDGDLGSPGEPNQPCEP